MYFNEIFIVNQHIIRQFEKRAYFLTLYYYIDFIFVVILYTFILCNLIVLIEIIDINRYI